VTSSCLIHRLLLLLHVPMLMRRRRHVTRVSLLRSPLHALQLGLQGPVVAGTALLLVAGRLHVSGKGLLVLLALLVVGDCGRVPLHPYLAELAKVLGVGHPVLAHGDRIAAAGLGEAGRRTFREMNFFVLRVELSQSDFVSNR
jgi:hypothetical protein